MRRCSQEVVVCSRTFRGTLDQIREARRFLGDVVAGLAAADDVILCGSELAGNSVLHSASGRPGGTFTLRAEVRPGIVLIEIADEGGPWVKQAGDDDRPHGLDLVGMLATECGVCGDTLAGRVSWARFSWHGSAAPG